MSQFIALLYPRTTAAAWAAVLARLADYVQLSKPRIAVMALAAVAVGYVCAGQGAWSVPLLLHTLCGAGLLAAASSAWNQVHERRLDAMMRRTCDRPLPAGRLGPAEAGLFGAACAAAGLVWLAAAVNGMAASVGAAIVVSYVGIYTPLKRVTALNTLAGAVPGALPPVLGWAASSGGLDAGAGALFAVLFAWQFPHFMAIAWLHRADYARAGMRMLTVTENSGRAAGVTSVVYAAALVPVSLLPAELGISGMGYAAAAIALGTAYLGAAVLFLARRDDRSARRLLLVSLVYLPALLGALVIDRWRLLI